MSYKKVKDVVDELKHNNFRFVRQKGSHMVFTDGKNVVIVPDHGNKGIEKGTYFNILRQAGLKR
jgi:mRNA interferase HicA